MRSRDILDAPTTATANCEATTTAGGNTGNPPRVTPPALPEHDGFLRKISSPVLLLYCQTDTRCVQNDMKFRESRRSSRRSYCQAGRSSCLPAAMECPPKVQDDRSGGGGDYSGNMNISSFSITHNNSPHNASILEVPSALVT